MHLYAVAEGTNATRPVIRLALDRPGALEELPDGVYTAFRTFPGARVLCLDEHLARTQRSMDALGWGWGLDQPLVRRALAAALASWPKACAKVRIHVLERQVTVQQVSARIFVLLTPLVEVPRQFVEEGVGLGLAPELQRLRPRIKTTDFMRIRRPHPLERQWEYDHLLTDHEGQILEGTSSNFYAVRGGTILTRSEGVLEGITRGFLALLAKDLGLAFEWRGLGVDELGSLDEAFISSSTRGVVPVVRVGQTPIGTGKPGPITRRLMEAYALAARDRARPL